MIKEMKYKVLGMNGRILNIARVYYLLWSRLHKHHARKLK